MLFYLFRHFWFPLLYFYFLLFLIVHFYFLLYTLKAIRGAGQYVGSADYKSSFMAVFEDTIRLKTKRHRSSKVFSITEHSATTSLWDAMCLIRNWILPEHCSTHFWTESILNLIVRGAREVNILEVIAWQNGDESMAPFPYHSLLLS